MNLISYWTKFCVPFLRARVNAKSELGASLVEYALLVALIAVVCIGAVTLVGTSSKGQLSKVGGSIGAAG